LQLFARSASILGSNTFTRASVIDEPLHFKDDLWVNPGDLLMGDNDGVVVVPPTLVEQVLELCRRRKDIDDQTVAALQMGAFMGETLATYRK
jgi:regulator of RNase E activity RraA